MKNRLRLVLSLSMVAMLVGATPARADLDRSFGGDGRVVTPLDLPGPIWYASPIRSAAAADGGIVVAAGAQVLRYRPDGGLDRGFGEGGIASVPVPAEAEFSLAAVAVDAGGGTVVAGTALFREDPLQDPSSEPPPIFDFRREAMIVRFDRQGDLDRGFGAGGVLLSAFGSQGIYDDSGRTYDDPGVGISDMAIDSQGRIVVAGSFVYRVEPCEAGPRSLEAGYLVRISPDGAMDPSFGEGGKVVESSLKSISTLALGPEDNAFAVGDANHACASGPRLLFAFRANGERDSGFARSGRTQTFSRFGIADVAIDRRGRPLVLSGAERPRRSGGEGSPFLHPHRSLSEVLRLTPTGKRDRSFGRGGKATIVLPGSRSHFNAIAAGPAGAVYAGGTIVSRTRLRVRPSSFVALGLDRHGRRLRGFGSEGILTTAFARASSGARDTVIDTRGRVILAGGFETPSTPHGEGLALARYRPGG